MQVFDLPELRWRPVSAGTGLEARHTAVERSYCRLELTGPGGRRLGFFVGEERGQELDDGLSEEPIAFSKRRAGFGTFWGCFSCDRRRFPWPKGMKNGPKRPVAAV